MSFDQFINYVLLVVLLSAIVMMFTRKDSKFSEAVGTVGGGAWLVAIVSVCVMLTAQDCGKPPARPPDDCTPTPTGRGGMEC